MLRAMQDHKAADQLVPVLPQRAYTDPEWFAWEQEHLFSKVWQFAGFIEDLEHSGDYLTVQCGLTNLLVIKGEDGQLRAFHNLCRHRGTQLLRAVGKRKKVLACPYHDWVYNLEGELRVVPDERKQFPGIQKKNFCLHKASVEIWRGMVFVHPQPQPEESLAEFFGEAADALMPHHPELLEEWPEGRATHEIQANWKLVAENYIDGYHLARLHSGTLNMYDHAKQEVRFAGRHYLFFEPPTKAYREKLPQAAMAPLIDHVQSAPMGAYVPLVFPNLGLAGSEASFSTFYIEPVAVDRCRVHLRSKIMPASAWKQLMQLTSSAMYMSEGMAPKDPQFPKEHPLGSADFMAEDIYVCEQQQRSFASPWFAVGPTAKEQEFGVRGFQKIVGDWMKAQGIAVPGGTSVG